VNTGALPLRTRRGKKFDLLKELQSVAAPGKIGEWSVLAGEAAEPIAGRLCVLRKSEKQARRAIRKIHRKAQKGGPKPKTETLAYANYVLVFTTLTATALSAKQVLEWYRLRWQIELVFKRLKALLRVGHVPKYDDLSSKAWLYGKLLIALLAEKLIRVGRTISPWGVRRVCSGFQSSWSISRNGSSTFAPAESSRWMRLHASPVCIVAVKQR
jgi:hypothetical protein